MKEKQFFLNIKKQLPSNTFIQKIENKFNSGFTDVIIINEKFPLFIELKSPTKGNKFKIELSQISTHLRIQANKYVSFFLVRHPSTSLLYLFEGGSGCKFCASNDLCTFILSTEADGFLVRGSLSECLASANQKIRTLVQK